MATITYNLQIDLEIERDNTVVVPRTVDLDDQAIDEFHVGYDDVPNAATDQVLNFGGVTTATTFILVSDQDLTIKLSGGTETLFINADVPFVAHDVTAATVSNASGDDAEVEYWCLGT